LASAPARPLPDHDVEAMPAEELLRWAAAEFSGRLCLTCSWQRQSSVLVHMVSELGLDVDVVELDTLVLFPETYETRDRLVERYGVTLKSVRPIDAPDRLWETDPDRCCGIRKVEPLERALRGYDAWITGIRREQSPTRANSQKLEWSERYGVWKVQPLVDWNAKRVDAYIHVNEIPYNPLHDRGYPSIGCVPCTRPVRPGEDERAGRWTGSGKLECGIHVNAPLIKESND
jgi:phosphoadenosine phosphosulfate reductase